MTVMLKENKDTPRRKSELFLKFVRVILNKPQEEVCNWRNTESVLRNTISGNRELESSHPEKTHTIKPNSLLSDNQQNESVDDAVEPSKVENLRKKKCDADDQISPEVVDDRSPKTPKTCYELEKAELIGCFDEEKFSVNIARIMDSPVASYSIENIIISDSEKNISPVQHNSSKYIFNKKMYEYTDSSDEFSAKDSVSFTPKSKSKCVRNLSRSLSTIEKNQRRCTIQASSTINKKKQSEGENLSRSFETKEKNERISTRETSSNLVESETFTNGFESSEDTEETSVSEASNGDVETNKENLRRSSRRITLLFTENDTKKQSSKKGKWKLDNEKQKIKSKKLRSTRNETHENNRESIRIKKRIGKDAGNSSSSSDDDIPLAVRWRNQSKLRSTPNGTHENNSENIRTKKRKRKDAGGSSSSDDIPCAIRWRNQLSKQMDQKNEEDTITDLEDSAELFHLESSSVRKKSMENEPSKLRTPRTRCSLRSNNQVIMEEQEVVVETLPRTPKSIKTIKKNSFHSPKVHIKNLTHSLGERRTPGGTPTTPRERARMMLLGSAAPESLPCRENEFNKLYDYLFDKIKTETGGFMYISGAPGTGKTATVERVVKKLVDESKKRKLPDFKVIEINGVRLTNPREVYRQIWRQFSGKTVGLQTALNSLNELFQPKKLERKRSLILLIIDEFDCLSNKKQDVMYKILEWQKEDDSRLIVLSIANTFDFLENKKLFSRMKFDKVPFIAYTFRDLEAIILNRLQGIHVFAPEAIEFMARKVAALTGDARRALNISRQVLDITREEKDDVIITIDHVVDALKKILSDPIILKIKRLHVLQKIALRAIRDELLRTGLSECSLKSGVYEQFKGICSLEGLKDPAYGSILKAFHYLADFNFIRINGYPFAYDTKMWLNAEPDSIHLALNATKL